MVYRLLHRIFGESNEVMNRKEFCNCLRNKFYFPFLHKDHLCLHPFQLYSSIYTFPTPNLERRNYKPDWLESENGLNLFGGIICFKKCELGTLHPLNYEVLLLCSPFLTGFVSFSQTEAGKITRSRYVVRIRE